MVLVFFIFTFLFILLTVLVLSTISIKIEKLHLSNLENKLKVNYVIYLELYFLNKLKIFSLREEKKDLEKLSSKMNLKSKLQKVNFQEMKKDISKDELKEIFKKLKIELYEINLKLEIGTGDVIITSAIIVILSTLLGMILTKAIKKYDSENHKFSIYPIYQNRNLIKLDLNCIIKVKMVHIIYIIYVLLKKRRVDKHERTSNRRSYDYSYE